MSTGRQEAFESALRDLGFVKPSGSGMATRGWIHPELRLGFEVVSSVLLDGLADRDRVKFLDLGPDGIATIIAVEDIIADRMGQYASGLHRKCSLRHRACSVFTATSIAPSWTVEFAKRRLAIMASTISKRPVPLDEFVADIERRRQETGITELPRTAGNRRTASKRALLKAIEEAGGKW